MDEILWRGIEKGISLFRNCDWKIKEIEEEKKRRMIIENEDEPQERERDGGKSESQQSVTT